jgi:hypothetical protein
MYYDKGLHFPMYIISKNIASYFFHIAQLTEYIIIAASNTKTFDPKATAMYFYHVREKYLSRQFNFPVLNEWLLSAFFAAKRKID